MTVLSRPVWRRIVPAMPSVEATSPSASAARLRWCTPSSGWSKWSSQKSTTMRAPRAFIVAASSSLAASRLFEITTTSNEAFLTSSDQPAAPFVATWTWWPMRASCCAGMSAR
jgi:hypothetical protein